MNVLCCRSDVWNLRNNIRFLYFIQRQTMLTLISVTPPCTTSAQDVGSVHALREWLLRVTWKTILFFCASTHRAEERSINDSRKDTHFISPSQLSPSWTACSMVALETNVWVKHFLEEEKKTQQHTNDTGEKSGRLTRRHMHRHTLVSAGSVSEPKHAIFRDRQQATRFRFTSLRGLNHATVEQRWRSEQLWSETACKSCR